MNKKSAKLFQLAAIAALVGGLLQPFASLPQAYAADTVRKSLDVNKTLTAPVIDGKLDESLWAIEQPLSVQVGQGTFKESRFGLLWDNQYLYIGVRADDDQLISGASGNWFEQDNINVFFDPTQHRSAPFATDDMQIGFVYKPDTSAPEFHFGAALNGHSGKDEKKILRAISQTGTGWAAEVAVPWDMLHFDPNVKKQLGIELSATDRYGADAAEQRTSYWSAYNSTSFWNDTSGYGTLNLVDGNPVTGSVNPVLLQENFDNVTAGQLPRNWISDVNAGSPPFTVVKDTYGNGRMTFDGNASGKQSRVMAPVQWDNYAIEADVKFDAFLNTGRWASLMFRAPSGGKPPYSQMAIKQNGTIETAYRKPDGSWTSPIAATGSQLVAGKEYTMKVRVFDNNVKNYFKTKTDPAFVLYGNKSLTSDVLPEKGSIGLQGDQSKVSFDNVKVTRITADRLDLTVPGTLEALSGATSVTSSVYYSDGITEAPAADHVKLYSSDESIIKIVNNQIYPVKPGKATVKAVYFNAEATREITVTPSLTGVKTVTLKHDDGYFLAVANQASDLSRLTLKAEFTDLTSGTVMGDQLAWTSDSADVAFAGGQLTVKKKGVYTISGTKDSATISILVVAKDAGDAEYVLYEENFDSLTEGTLPTGWTRKQGTTASAAVVKSGAFEMNALAAPDNPSRVLLPSYLGLFGNYKIEADVTHLAANNTARWHSFMYRIQNHDYPYYQMAVRQDATAANGIEFAERTPANAWSVIDRGSYAEAIDPAKMYHYIVKAYGNRVQESVNNKIMVDTDAATAYVKGEIGLQADGSKMRLDNLRVTLQQDALPPLDFTVREVIEMGRFPFQNWLGDEERGDAEKLIDGIVDRLQLRELQHRSVSLLSGGERQRVALGKVMAQEPRLLLLDEPTTYLDIGYQVQMMEWIRLWQQEAELTVIAVLHDLNLAAQYCDRLMLLQEGRIVGIGQPDEVVRPELLKRVYGTEPIVLEHPVSGVPQVLLQGRNGQYLIG